MSLLLSMAHKYTTGSIRFCTFASYGILEILKLFDVILFFGNKLHSVISVWNDFKSNPKQYIEVDFARLRLITS